MTSCLHTVPLGLAFSSYTVWLVLTAVLASVACGVLGCFLVLRRLSLLGDAISHAVLPGLAAAFLITRSRDVMPMLAGAAIAGLLAAGLSATLSRFAKVNQDASLGVSFTTLFALGVLLMAYIPRNIDLDPSCVLYGAIEMVPLQEKISVLGVGVPPFIRSIAVVLLLNTALILVFWKELKLTSFDAAFAVSMGFSAGAVHYVLMAAVAWTSVACFEAVGSILVVAMLIAPGATAHLLTDRYPRLFFLAAILAASSAAIGCWLALVFNTTAAGMMSVVAGVQFALALLLAPHHGVLAKLATRAALALRIRREDILAALFRRTELASSGMAASGATSAPSAGTRTSYPAGPLTVLATRALRRAGYLARGPAGEPVLLPAGLDAGRQIVRSHRLWESFLSDQAGIEVDHLHDPSHRMEHFITRDMSERLRDSYADRPDPHGKPVPPPTRNPAR
ncbi:MAG: metal ABC transporter permease [Phycisphaerales bacterium]